MNILIAEDDEFNKIVLNDMIKILYPDSNVTIASDGVEALEYFKNSEFDILLSDVGMPNMDGYELIKEVKKHNSNIPAVSITAFSVVGDKEKLMMSGFDGYVSKPIDFDELKSVLEKFL